MSFWYLASPYSKYPQGHQAAYAHVSRQAGLLLKAGVEVFSPIAHSHPIALYGEIDNLDGAYWLDRQKPFMAAAKGMISLELPGWEESDGMKHERAYFRSAGKPVVRMVPGVVPTQCLPAVRRVVGLCGYAGSGKDEAAKSLVGWHVGSFSEPLWRSLLAINPVVYSEIKWRWLAYPLIREIRLYEHLARCKGDYVLAKRHPEVRWLLQKLGTEGGRDIHGQDCWIDLMRREIDATAANVVITNIRFSNEVALLREYGGKLFHVSRPGVGPVNGHKSDAELGKIFEQADAIIANTGTTADLHAAILEAVA